MGLRGADSTVQAQGASGKREEAGPGVHATRPGWLRTLLSELSGQDGPEPSHHSEKSQDVPGQRCKTPIQSSEQNSPGGTPTLDVTLHSHRLHLAEA